MGIDIVHKCPDCEQDIAKIFDFYLCNSCDVVRDRENNILLTTYLWKPECIRVKYDFLYTVLLAKKGEATLEDLLKQVERKFLEYGCDERVKMPLHYPPPDSGLTKLEEELLEKYKAYRKQGLSHAQIYGLLREPLQQSILFLSYLKSFNETNNP